MTRKENVPPAPSPQKEHKQCPKLISVQSSVLKYMMSVQGSFQIASTSDISSNFPCNTIKAAWDAFVNVC